MLVRVTRPGEGHILFAFPLSKVSGVSPWLQERTATLGELSCLLLECGGGNSSCAFSEDSQGEAEVGVESHSFTVQQTPSGKRESGSLLHSWIPLALISIQVLCDVPPQYAVGCRKLYY